MPASFYLRDWRRYGFAYRVYILCFVGVVCNLRFVFVVGIAGAIFIGRQ